MSSAQYVQECPICGRPVQIRVVYLGRQVSCQHCGGQFVAQDPTNRSSTSMATGSSLLERAQQLLEHSALRLTLLRGAA